MSSGSSETAAKEHDSLLHGGCACGAFRFSVSGEPKRVGMCHCMTCRRVQGAPFAVYVMFEREQVTLEGHTEAWQSSADGRRHFCPVCGSTAFTEGLSANEIEIPLGAFDRTGLYEPQYELWTCRREPWLPHGVRKEYENDRQP